MRQIGLFVCSVLLATCATAADRPSWDRCFDDAGTLFGIHPALLRAIAMQESSMRPDAVNKATFNGSQDVGVMQINSGWFPTLRNNGVDPDRLMEPCVNIAVGAWILSQSVQRHGMDWKAVGAYHSPTAERQVAYARKVHDRLLTELARPAPAATAAAPPAAQSRRVGRTAREELAAVEARNGAPGDTRPQAFAPVVDPGQEEEG
jgi:soluble lytic murein transglycosylase-like protein